MNAENFNEILSIDFVLKLKALIEQYNNAKDEHQNSIYHICCKFGNTESLKYLINNYSDSNNLILSKNSQNETILHCALHTENLEMLKLIMNKIYEINNVTIEQTLFAKNKFGYTFFHIACIKGYFNIVEYILKDKKLHSFIEHLDNNNNTPLHLATINGHSSIVELLCEYDADTGAKNEGLFL